MKSYFWAVLIFFSGTCIGQEKKAKRYWTEEDRQELISALNATKSLLFESVQNLTAEQWNFRLDDNTWSVSEIFEHVGLQQDMHVREVLVISQTPPQHKRAKRMKNHYEDIMAYEFDPNPGKAGWMVEPAGRWCDKTTALKEYSRSCDKLIEYLKTTGTDLRVHFTYRKNLDNLDFRSVRDLHQILLTTIAHVRRHTHQIDRIKAHPSFPKGN